MRAIGDVMPLVFTSSERTRIGGDESFDAFAPADTAAEFDCSKRAARRAMRVFQLFEYLVGVLRMLQRFVSVA